MTEESQPVQQSGSADRIQAGFHGILSPELVEECRRQSLLVAQSDAANADLARFMDAAWVDLISDLAPE
ncbi:antitoxin MazE-like protein [Rhizobium sp. RU20A]|uniref:antitoxin MazE-like protein n=1 Tax=Rhizobium sp. RU20A TaxID=1907412 RepID=UPI00122C3362|nr:antitoxin MazE-like protein [Rhizobium sp. RU20A]